MNKIRSLVKDTRGATLVEYMILVGMIAILAMLAFKAFGSSVKTKINQEASSVGKIQGTP
jgi:pilus assembly protein Flp/PilA